MLNTGIHSLTVERLSRCDVWNHSEIRITKRHHSFHGNLDDEPCIDIVAKPINISSPTIIHSDIQVNCCVGLGCNKFLVFIFFLGAAREASYILEGRNQKQTITRGRPLLSTGHRKSSECVTPNFLPGTIGV